MLLIIVMTLYLLTLTALGIYKSKKIKTQADFAVAGRSLSSWVLVGTMLATWVGTGSILGNAGKTYDTGIAALILPLGSILGIILLTQIAGKVRSYEKFTVPEIIGERYGEVARILCVIALVMAYMVIVSYQYNAGGAVLTTIFNTPDAEPVLSAEFAVIIAATFIIIYTMLAGLVSVAYTDVGNGIIMIISLALAFPFLWWQAGGWSGMEVAFANMGKQSHMQFFGVYTPMQIINYTLPPFLLILGDANMYQRFFASKDAKSAKRATIWLIFAVAFVELLIISCAWVSSSMISDAATGKHVLIYAANRFFPPLLGALLLTTIIGIIISTADSYLLVPATTIMRDIYQNYINPDADEKKIVLISRMLIIVLGLLAYYVSRGFASSATFFDKALYAYTIYGAAITPCLVAALFWKKASRIGAISSIISGTLMTLLWKEAPSISLEFIKNITSSNFYKNTDEVLPAIVMSVTCLIVFSLMFPDRKKS